MRVLHVASEAFPLVKTGGLADVMGALPDALARCGADTRLLLPGYPAVLDGLSVVGTVFDDANIFDGGWGRVLQGQLRGIGVPAYVLECGGLFARPGNPYSTPAGDWPDNHRRFAALCWAAWRLAGGADGAWLPAIVHGHDWQAGLAPAYLKLWGGAAASITTIHNIAYQGWFPAETLPELGLPAHSFGQHGVELHGGIGFLKAGLYYADRLTTVSRTYAREIQEPAHGSGLDGLLRARAADLSGIVNGVDYAIWNPAADSALPAPFDAGQLDGKAAAKAALQQRFGLPERPDAVLFGVISRLTWHKGLDLLLDALPLVADLDCQLVLLGSGEAELESGFRAAADGHRVAVLIGYDEPLAHLVEAGSDVILVPSRAEPCGLTQLYALRYGALPLVRRTGGLADTVVNADPEAVRDGRATGFLFDDATADALAGTMRWAAGLYADRPLWRGLQRTAMRQDFSWDAAAREYIALYEGLAGP